MISDRVTPLPEWNQLRLHLQASGSEIQRWKEELASAGRVYEQWRDVMQLVLAFCDDILPSEHLSANGIDFRALILENALVVAPKIRSAAGDTLYAIKMENAALIRFNCRQMMEQVGCAVLMGKGSAARKAAIGEAMTVFRERFRSWIAFFRPDGFSDEWGLYPPR